MALIYIRQYAFHSKSHTTLKDYYTTNNNSRTPPAQARAPNVTPNREKRKSTSITMRLTVPNCTPQGPYCRGAYGPLSVLQPRCYGNATTGNVTLLNELTLFSGNCRLNRSALVVNRSSFANTGAINDDHNMIEQHAAVDSLLSAGLDVSGIDTGLTPFLSSVVCQALLGPMESIGVCHISSMACFLEETEKNGTILKRNAKGHFFFAPMMVRDMRRSTVNNLNQPEFFSQADGSLKYNKEFWSANLELKILSTGGHFATINVGMFQPPWTIPEQHREEHNEALQYMLTNGPVVKGCATPEVTLLTLKKEYAHVFLAGMKSQLVVKARMAGFHPIWLMKNALLQKSQAFGINGWQFSSLDKSPKSYLSLVGFYKGTEADGNLSIITLTNQNNEFLSVTD